MSWLNSIKMNLDGHYSFINKYTHF